MAGKFQAAIINIFKVLKKECIINKQMVSLVRKMNTMKTLDSIYINLKQKKLLWQTMLAANSLFVHTSFLTL